jgi:hypothetical protein
VRRLLSLWLFGVCSTVGLMLPHRALADGPSVDECLAASDEGQVLRDQSKYIRARDAFRTCAQTACPSIVQRTCVRWLAEIEEAIPTVVLAARGASDESEKVLDDVSVDVDGAPLINRLTGTATPVDPGRHVFAFKRGATTVTVEALINATEKNRLIVARFGADASSPRSRRPPPPGSEPRDQPGGGPSLVLPVTLGAIGVAAFVTAGILGGGAVGDLHALERDPCATTGTCSSDQVHSVRTRLVVADVGIALGIVAIAGAGLVWWLSHPAH